MAGPPHSEGLAATLFTGSGSKSTSFSKPSGASVLIVSFVIADPSDVVSSVTYGGVALTQIGVQTGGGPGIGEGTCAMWELDDLSGTSGTTLAWSQPQQAAVEAVFLTGPASRIDLEQAAWSQSSGTKTVTVTGDGTDAKAIIAMGHHEGFGNPTIGMVNGETEISTVENPNCRLSVAYLDGITGSQAVGGSFNGGGNAQPRVIAALYSVGDVEIEFDVLSLEAEIPAGVDVLLGGDVDVRLFEPLELEAEIPAGVSVEESAAMQVALEGLDDERHRTTTGGTEGQVLTYHEESEPTWEDAAGGASAIDDLTDVNAPSPGDGEVLTWDDAAGEWVAAPGATGSGNVVGVWDDADPGTPAQDETIWYDTDEDSPVASGESSGTAFPSSPLNGQRFYRTDVRGGMWFAYNSSIGRWLSVQQFERAMVDGHSYGASFGVAVALPHDYPVHLTAWDYSVYVTGTWTYALSVALWDESSYPAVDSISTSGLSTSRWYADTRALSYAIDATGANSGTNPRGLYFVGTRTGGNNYVQGAVRFKLSLAP